MKKRSLIFPNGIVKSVIVLTVALILTACAPAAVELPDPTLPVPAITTAAPTELPAPSAASPTEPVIEAPEVSFNRDEYGNIIPNPVGGWTKLPQGENQRILIGPEGSNIVLELDSRLGMSEFMFNNGENGFFNRDGKTPQEMVYEAVNNSLYYYWCSTQGGGCANKPIDMRGIDIDFWTIKNEENRGNIRIDNGVTFRVMPVWDKSGGSGSWKKLTDTEKVFKVPPFSEEIFYEVSPEGNLIMTFAIDDVDMFKEWPLKVSLLPPYLLAFLSAGWNLHDETPISYIYDLVEYTYKKYPEVGDWINQDLDSQTLALNDYFMDNATILASKDLGNKAPNMSVFYVR